jgi:hypothetical protein
MASAIARGGFAVGDMFRRGAVTVGGAVALGPPLP